MNLRSMTRILLPGTCLLGCLTTAAAGDKIVFSAPSSARGPVYTPERFSVAAESALKRARPVPSDLIEEPGPPPVPMLRPAGTAQVRDPRTARDDKSRNWMTEDPKKGLQREREKLLGADGRESRLLKDTAARLPVSPATARILAEEDQSDDATEEDARLHPGQRGAGRDPGPAGQRERSALLRNITSGEQEAEATRQRDREKRDREAASNFGDSGAGRENPDRSSDYTGYTLSDFFRPADGSPRAAEERRAAQERMRAFEQSFGNGSGRSVPGQSFSGLGGGGEPVTRSLAPGPVDTVVTRPQMSQGATFQSVRDPIAAPGMSLGAPLAPRGPDPAVIEAQRRDAETARRLREMPVRIEAIPRLR